MKKLKMLAAFAVLVLALSAAVGCTQSADDGDKPQPEPAPEIVRIEDFEISADGIVTFTGKGGTTYYLYADGARLCEIKSGDGVTELLTETKKSYEIGGENTESNKITAYKPAGITDLKLEGFKLSFSGGNSEYKLFVGKKTDEVAVSGEDIQNKLSVGANAVYLYADGVKEADAVKVGAKSNEISVFLHDEPRFGVTSEGKLSFEQIYGFGYELSAGGAPFTAENGDDLSETLNGLSAGETEFTLSVVGGKNGNDYYLVKEGCESAVYKVNKHFAPQNVEVTAKHTVTFSCESESAELYVNGNYKSMIKNGDSVYKYYDGKDNLIKLVAASDEKGWRSDESAEISLSLKGYLKTSVVSEKGYDVYGTDKGIAVTGADGLVAEYSEQVSLSDVAAVNPYAVRLSLKDGVSANGFERVVIKFTDVYDGNKGVALYMVNGLKIGFGGATYYAGGAATTDFASLDPGEFTAVSNPAAALSSESFDLRVKFDISENKFYVALDEPEYTWYYGIKSDFGSAEFSSENGSRKVKISVEYLKTDATSGFVFETLGDSLAPAIEERDGSGTFYWNRAEGVSVIKGEKTYKNTTLINGTPDNPLTLCGYEIKTGNDSFVNLNGAVQLTDGLKLIEFAGGVDNENGTQKGEYTVNITDTSYLVRLTDKSDPKKVLTIEYKTASWDFVGYFGFTYTNGTDTLTKREYDGVPMYGFNFGNTDAGAYNIPKLVYFGNYMFGYHETAVDFTDKVTGANLAEKLASDNFGKEGVYISLCAGSAGMFVTEIVNGK